MQTPVHHMLDQHINNNMIKNRTLNKKNYSVFYESGEKLWFIKWENWNSINY